MITLFRKKIIYLEFLEFLGDLLSLDINLKT